MGMAVAIGSKDRFVSWLGGRGADGIMLVAEGLTAEVVELSSMRGMGASPLGT